MKTLKELMELLPVNDAKFYCAEVANWDDSKKAKLETLANSILKAGAKKPYTVGVSEVSENIPQFGRYLLLKNLFAVIKDPNGIIIEAADFDDDIQHKVDLVTEVLGDELLNKMLYAYGKAIISGVVSILDEGNYSAEKNGVSWFLSETTEKGEPTKRIIQGLHEDFYDFEE